MRFLPTQEFGRVAQLNSASDFGSEGWGFESLRGHYKQKAHPPKADGFLFYGKMKVIAFQSWSEMENNYRSSWTFYLQRGSH